MDHWQQYIETDRPGQRFTPGRRWRSPSDHLLLELMNWRRLGRWPVRRPPSKALAAGSPPPDPAPPDAFGAAPRLPARDFNLPRGLPEDPHGGKGVDGLRRRYVDPRNGVGASGSCYRGCS